MKFEFYNMVDGLLKDILEMNAEKHYNEVTKKRKAIIISKESEINNNYEMLMFKLGI